MPSISWIFISLGSVEALVADISLLISLMDNRDFVPAGTPVRQLPLREEHGLYSRRYATW
jgi:hypothetical protein